MLDKILSDSEIQDVLATVCDFEIAIDADDLWFVVKADESFRDIAREGAGGVFLLGEESGMLLFVSSEGQAGIVANSLEQFLRLVIAYPYWYNFLGEHLNNDIEKRKDPVFIEDLEANLQEFEPEIDEIRQRLYSALQLQKAEDPIADLHYAINHLGKSIQVCAVNDPESSCSWLA